VPRAHALAALGADGERLAEQANRVVDLLGSQRLLAARERVAPLLRGDGGDEREEKEKGERLAAPSLAVILSEAKDLV
jgi:hypothetical protein